MARRESAGLAARESDGPTLPGFPSDLQIRQVDLQAGLRTSALLQYGGIGASGDVGVAKIGPGTLAVGGSLAYEACSSTCWGAPLDLSQHSTWLEGRAGYHFTVPRARRLDIYPMLTVGVVFAGSSIHVGDGTVYKGTGTAPSVGLGGGIAYYFADRFFVSGEAMLRYAGGSYDYELARGPAQSFDRRGVSDWNSNTIALSLGAGVRF